MEVTASFSLKSIEHAQFNQKNSSVSKIEI